MLTFILLLALLCGKVDGTGTPAPAFVEGIGEGPHSTPYSPAPTPEGTNGHPTFNPSTPAPTPGGSNGHPTFNPSTPAPTPEGSNSHPTFNPSTLPPIGSGGSPCFDPDSSASVNIDTYLGGVRLMFHGCEISDDDLEDVAALFDEVGRASITSVWLTSGTVTTLPEGYFDGFENLLWLSVENHALSSLPAGIFDELHGLRTLILINNDLTTLPPDLFGRGLSGLERLELQENELVTIEAGTFDALTSLYSLNLIETSLVSLPFGLFAELDNLEFLQIALNFDLKCIPYTDAAMNWFESTSDTCDCTQAEEDACSEGFVCNPAATDHDCGATPAPTPGPTFEGTNGGPTIAPDTPAPTFQGTVVVPPTTTTDDDYACLAELQACVTDSDCTACLESVASAGTACVSSDFDDDAATCNESLENACCAFEGAGDCLSNDLMVAWLDCVAEEAGCDVSITNCADTALLGSASATPSAMVGGTTAVASSAAVLLAFMNV